MDKIRKLRLIEEIICNRNLIDLGQMFEDSNRREIVEIRQQFYYACAIFLKGFVTLAEIGSYGREMYSMSKKHNHTNVIYSKKAYQNLMDCDEGIKEGMESILEEIKMEDAKRRLLLLTARNYFNGKIEKILSGMSDCKNNADFDTLLVNCMSRAGKMRYNACITK